MIIKKFIKGSLKNNNYLVIDEVSNEALLIDCTEACDDIIDYINNIGVRLKYILLTHAHFDHILGVDYFKKKTGAEVFLHKKDLVLLKMLNSFITEVTIPTIDVMFDDDVELFLGNKKIEIIHTPGHSEGSVCFLIEKFLFSGDTMFYGTYGRVDLPFGNLEKMKNSLKKLFVLDDDIKVYPGHGRETFVGYEKKSYL